MDINHLNWIDYFIVGIIGISVLISFLRGFVREAVSLVIWVVAALVALKFANQLSPHFFEEHLTSPLLRYLAAFAALFIMVLIAGALINILLSALIERTGMGPIDRLLGLVFGAVRGALIVALALMFLEMSNVQPLTALKGSVLVPQFNGLVTWLNSFMPKQLKEWGDQFSKSALSEVAVQQLARSTVAPEDINRP